jgi:uncharacterized membrane protein
MTLAVSTYEWYLMVHILTAVIWVGGSHMLQLLGTRLLRANDPHRLAGFAKDVDWVGTRVLAPSSLLLVIFGFLLVEEADIGYPFWVIFGIAVFAYSFVTGAFFIGPQAGKLGKLIEARGEDDPEVHRLIRRILVLSRVELLLLVLVVVDMTIKPFD